MASSFFFYDLETSGLNSRRQRIMQFAGQRTDVSLNPVGKPINVLVKLSDDILPEPQAALVTGITPQQTLQDGYTEAEFSKTLSEKVFTPDTITTGFNNIRFDDEFIRHTLWRNFYDPYEWAWKDGRSRWDLLDVVRMTRALRPDGIKWPVNEEGQPVNKLELLSAENGLDHIKAHDAMSDVEALISLTKLIKQKQPQLYEYLLNLRDKRQVASLVNLEDPKPFVYSSGRYSKEYQHTTVAFPISTGSKPGSVLVYDLRFDPAVIAGFSKDKIKKLLFASREERQAEDFVPIPVKELMLNRCPAVAPLGVIKDKETWQRLDLDLAKVKKHLKKLSEEGDLRLKLAAVFSGREPYPASEDVEDQLYDGFMSDADKSRLQTVRKANAEQLADLHPQFVDERLPKLLLRYKARNFPKSLSQDEQAAWEEYRAKHLAASLPKFSASLSQLASQKTDENSQFVLQELQLWAESILPAD